MHTGRAEAWWHGEAKGGPFTDIDMSMSYPRIAAECDVPVKLFAYDGKPSARVHEWAALHWILLCRVKVHTDVPVVPARHDDRTIWPVGDFETTLWQPELELLTRNGGTYEVLEQWRYNGAPALREWAQWSIDTCGDKHAPTTEVQRTFVKHQARAVIGRLGLRNSSWDVWGGNPYGWCGLTDLVDADEGVTRRMLHVGERTFVEGSKRESGSSLPQITGYIMAVARVRLWEAAVAAGIDQVLHLDTDSLIATARGTQRLLAAAQAGLPGSWRTKDTWRSLTVIGPRHYTSTSRRVVPGIPKAATEVEPGKYRGEIWQSLASMFSEGKPDSVRLIDRTWKVRKFDGRRPWVDDGLAIPIRLSVETHETEHENAISQ
jgi:hypothetical protein